MTVTLQEAAVLDQVHSIVTEAGVFESCQVKDGRLVCAASNTPEPAAYRLDLTDAGPRVSLVMADRWLSGSIEGDLMHTGDSIEELIEEELADQDIDGIKIKMEHFRSDELLFTFAATLPESSDARSVAGVILAFNTCFSELGDMSEAQEED